MDITTLIVQLVGGAIGGNLVGGVINRVSLGAIGNTIAGLAGGFGVGQLLPMLLPLLGVDAGPVTETSLITADNLNLDALLTHIGVAAAGGGVATGVLGAIRSLAGGR